jgi:hypothetical protein
MAIGPWSRRRRAGGPRVAFGLAVETRGAPGLSHISTYDMTRHSYNYMYTAMNDLMNAHNHGVYFVRALPT